MYWVVQKWGVEGWHLTYKHEDQELSWCEIIIFDKQIQIKKSLHIFLSLFHILFCCWVNFQARTAADLFGLVRVTKYSRGPELAPFLGK